jgi:hypothetical protein
MNQNYTYALLAGGLVALAAWVYRSRKPIFDERSLAGIGSL